MLVLRPFLHTNFVRALLALCPLLSACTIGYHNRYGSLSVKCIQTEKLAVKYSEFRSTTTPRASALLLHGLNTDPEKMDGLAHFLTREGFHVFRIHFSRGSEATEEGSLAEHWVKELKALYCIAKVNHPDLPIVNLSYSLGAAVSAEAIRRDEEIDLKAMVFIAPAITPGIKSIPIYFLSLINTDLIALPSLAPKDYREKNFTTLKEYRALFNLASSAKSPSKSKTLAKIPTLVLIDKNDELVSPSALNNWLNEMSSSAWELTLLDRREKTGYPKHLLLDEKTSGGQTWAMITSRIKAFFGKNL